MKIALSRRTFASVDLDPAERTILTNIFTDTVRLLDDADGTGESAGGTESSTVDELEKLVGMSSGKRPADPALMRLLPDVDSDDDERSEEFRRLTENDIRQMKLGHLRTVLLTLDRSTPFSLSRGECTAWAVALADVRLVLASRLGIASDDDFEQLYARLDDLDEHDAMLVSVYDFLTWAQERVAGILLADLGDDAPSEQEEGR